MVVEGTRLVVVVVAIDSVVGVFATTEVELLLSGWVLLVELAGIVNVGRSGEVVGGIVSGDGEVSAFALTVVVVGLAS